MLPHRHVAISTLIGALSWMKTGNPTSCVAAVAAGVLPDLDHFADYLYFRQRGEHRLLLPLHGYEYVLLAGGIAFVRENEIVTIAALSYLIHLLADQVENRTRLLGYSLFFRAAQQFRVERISTVPDAAVQGRIEDMQRLRKWLLR